MKIATVKEVAAFLKLTESTVYTLAAEGKLSGFRIGNSWRFDMDEIVRKIQAAKEAKTDKSSRRGRKKRKEDETHGE